MASKGFGIILFFVGVLALFVHTTLPFLWAVAGIRAHYPLTPTEGFPAYLPAFTPPVGALLMVIGGLLFGRKKGR